MTDDMSEVEFDAAFADALPAKLAREYGVDNRATRCDPIRFHVHVTSTCPGITCACLRGDDIA